jgi:hypothetical protein
MRTIPVQPVVLDAPPRPGMFAFRARDVTGSQDILVGDIARGTPAGAVAQSIAARMDLPTNVPWALRNDRTGSWLRDDLPIDDQVQEDPDSSMTIVPKAHLGGDPGR